MAWAFARTSLKCDTLFVTLRRAVESRLSEFSAKDLANTAWAFARTSLKSQYCLAALARATESHNGNFTTKDMFNTLLLAGRWSLWVRHPFIHGPIRGAELWILRVPATNPLWTCRLSLEDFWDMDRELRQAYRQLPARSCRRLPDFPFSDFNMPRGRIGLTSLYCTLEVAVTLPSPAIRDLLLLWEKIQLHSRPRPIPHPPSLPEAHIARSTNSLRSHLV